MNLEQLAPGGTVGLGRSRSLVTAAGEVLHCHLRLRAKPSAGANSGTDRPLPTCHDKEGVDALNRLSTASGTTGWGTSYAYDGFGNLTDKNVTAGSAPPLHVTIDPATNQVRGPVGYDFNGNFQGNNDGVQQGYRYDAENRMTTVLAPSGNDSYAYDPSNLRVYKVEPSGKEWIFFYGPGGELLVPYFWAGGTWGSNTTYHYFAGRLVGTEQDRVGSVVPAGNGYYPYGEQSPPRRRTPSLSPPTTATRPAASIMLRTDTTPAFSAGF